MRDLDALRSKQLEGAVSQVSVSASSNKAFSISTSNSSNVGVKKCPPFGNSTYFASKCFANLLCTSIGTMIFYAGEAHAELCILAYFTVVPRLVEIAGCSLRRIAEVVVVPSANAYAFDFVFLCVSRARDCAGAVADEDGMFVRRELVSDEREPDGLST